MINIKFMKECCDNSTYERQPIFFILTYIFGVTSFLTAFIVGNKYEVPYLYSYLTSVFKGNTIISLLLPYILQVMLLWGVFFSIIGYVIIEPICRLKFRSKRKI